MAKQRYISTTIWDDNWFVEELNHAEKLFYFYLLTNEHTNIAGIYKISIRKISIETGFSHSDVRNMLETFQKFKKVFYQDEHIIMTNWPKHQNWIQSGKIHKGIRAILIKETPPRIIETISKGIIPYAYPIHTLSDGIDNLPIGYTYPLNYLDPDSHIESDIDSIIIPQDISQNDESFSADETVIHTLPQLGGKEFPFTKSQINTFIAAYPGVDVTGEINKIRAWLMSNKRRQKKDVLKFVNSWLVRAQDNAVKPTNRDLSGIPSQRTIGNDERFEKDSIQAQNEANAYWETHKGETNEPINF